LQLIVIDQRLHRAFLVILLNGPNYLHQQGAYSLAKIIHTDRPPFGIWFPTTINFF
jgi:hypothetical protein